MSVRRIMGAETEFGVLAPGNLSANPTVLSAQVVSTYDSLFHAELQAHSTAEWGYSSESPLSDSRGTEMPEKDAHATQLTHQANVLTSEQIAAEALQDSGLYAERLNWDAVTMNSILPNGARLYVDHAHPEYSSPEVASPMDAVKWDAAGDWIAAQVVQRSADSPVLETINLYKNNTDSKGQSYGSHENYQMSRDTDFDDVIQGLLPFFATRIIMTGAGRVGIGTKGETAGFQISQRADFFEREVGLETTIRRPLINTRDEPHADSERFRRLHVITGDANLSHVSNLLKFGTTSLVLALIEKGVAPHIVLADPVHAMHTVSHDLTLSEKIALSGGEEATALQIQREYLEAAEEYFSGVDEETDQVISLWNEVLGALETNLFSLANRLDWVAKYSLMRQYVAQGIGWDNPKLAALDIQYSDIRPQKGLYFKLVELGRMQTLFSPEEIADAARHAPENTRAYLRGEFIKRWPEELISVNWDTVVARNQLQTEVHRLTMDNPSAFTAEQTQQVLNSPTAVEVIESLNNVQKEK
ncbi:depupylase/deamidase Dop [uncultured Rothia sp.]|uniref:depupylase/deamidase Dop n=1 Tax=uncultured Rothia sp. TaxID=316088 RepID=UPI003217AAA3